MKISANSTLKSLAFAAAAALMISSAASAGTCQDNCYAKGQAAGEALESYILSQIGTTCATAGPGYYNCQTEMRRQAAIARVQKAAQVTAECNATC